jgi:hypothetical protein
LGECGAVEYVMVPVPEELVPKVLTFVSWKIAGGPGALGAADEWSDAEEALVRGLGRLDDAGRSVVEAIAAAALAGEDIGVTEVARRVGVSKREAVGILLEVNNVVAAEGGPSISFGVRARGGSAPGEFTWDEFAVEAADALKGRIVELARAHASG